MLMRNLARGLRTRRGWTSGRVRLLVVSVVALLLFAACSTAVPPPVLPGGTYVNNSYHFRIQYPSGWAASVLPDSNSTIPLTVLVARSGETATNSSIVSTLTITVFNMSNPQVAQNVALLKQETVAPNATLHATTIGGVKGFQSTPTKSALPGSSLSEIHTDYYIFDPNLEYQISTNAVTGDQSASQLATILKSFTILP